ncbi:hypothetical protein HZB89_01395 [archaeon]|nr:hypothetical protein [archaeon]
MKTNHLILCLQALVVASLLASFAGFFTGRLLMAAVQAVFLAAFCCLLFIGLKKSIDSGCRNSLLFLAFIYAAVQLPWLASSSGLSNELKALVNAGVFALLVFLAVVSRTLLAKKLECRKGNN